MTAGRQVYNVIQSTFDKEGKYDFGDEDLRKDFEMLRSNFCGYNISCFDDVENKETLVYILKMVVMGLGLEKK